MAGPVPLGGSNCSARWRLATGLQLSRGQCATALSGVGGWGEDVGRRSLAQCAWRSHCFGPQQARPAPARTFPIPQSVPACRRRPGGPRCDATLPASGGPAHPSAGPVALPDVGKVLWCWQASGNAAGRSGGCRGLSACAIRPAGALCPWRGGGAAWAPVRRCLSRAAAAVARRSPPRAVALCAWSRRRQGPYKELCAFAAAITWVFVVATVLAVFVAYGIGANDFANSFGSSVGSGTLSSELGWGRSALAASRALLAGTAGSLGRRRARVAAPAVKQAIAIAAVCEFGGAVLMGLGVTATISSGIADAGAFGTKPDVLAYGMACSLLASGTWLVRGARRRRSGSPCRLSPPALPSLPHVAPSTCSCCTARRPPADGHLLGVARQHHTLHREAAAWRRRACVRVPFRWSRGRRARWPARLFLADPPLFRSPSLPPPPLPQVGAVVGMTMVTAGRASRELEPPHRQLPLPGGAPPLAPSSRSCAAPRLASRDASARGTPRALTRLLAARTRPRRACRPSC